MLTLLTMCMICFDETAIASGIAYIAWPWLRAAWSKIRSIARRP